MMEKKKVEYAQCVQETLQALAEGRVLLAVRSPNGANAMAIGWGCPGIIWSRPVFVVLVRPSRYTYELIENSGDFTVNVAPKGLKEAVTYCGTVSGRHEDKLAKCGLTTLPSLTVASPIIAECTIHFECRVVHWNDLIPEHLAAPIADSFYASGDFHRCFFGEVLACRADSRQDG